MYAQLRQQMRSESLVSLDSYSKQGILDVEKLKTLEWRTIEFLAKELMRYAYTKDRMPDGVYDGTAAQEG